MVDVLSFKDTAKCEVLLADFRDFGFELNRILESCLKVPPPTLMSFNLSSVKKQISTGKIYHKLNNGYYYATKEYRNLRNAGY